MSDDAFANLVDVGLLKQRHDSVTSLCYAVFDLIANTA